MSDDRVESPTPDNTNWTDKQLPPVKPPTTGFLMQLFFVPMIIVSIIVGVWIMFGWLAQAGTNPKQLAENLRQLNKGSWQDAHNLANLLRDPREKELRQDTELATDLSKILLQLLEDPNLSVSPERRQLAQYLCRALGEFEITDGLASLIASLKNEDFKIRRSAVEGIAKLSANVNSEFGDSYSDLVAALKAISMVGRGSIDREEQLKFGEQRNVTAFALGVIGGDEAKDVLNLMLGDPYAEARYNAATGLARNGDLRAIGQLSEMLKLNNEDATKFETKKQELVAWKRNLVMVNGLRGVQQLYEANPSAEVDERLATSIKAIADADVLHSNDKLELERVMRFLEEHNP